jgi:hypothetical protein
MRISITEEIYRGNVRSTICMNRHPRAHVLRPIKKTHVVPISVRTGVWYIDAVPAFDIYRIIGEITQIVTTYRAVDAGL